MSAWPTTAQRGPRRPREKAPSRPRPIRPGDPDWHEQAEIDAWFSVVREGLNGRCWYDLYRPMSQQEALSFMAFCNSTTEVPT